MEAAVVATGPSFAAPRAAAAVAATTRLSMAQGVSQETSGPV